MHKYLSASELLVVGCCTLGGCGPGIIVSGWCHAVCPIPSPLPAAHLFSHHHLLLLSPRGDASHLCHSTFQPTSLFDHYCQTLTMVFFIYRNTCMPSFLGFAQHCMHVCVCVRLRCGKSETTLPLTWTAVCARPTDRPIGRLLFCAFHSFDAGLR
jgi:hypothetical protein